MKLPHSMLREVLPDTFVMNIGYDKALFTFALGVLLCSTSGYLLTGQQRHVVSELPELPEVDRPYRPVVKTARPTGAMAEWKAPSSQSWNSKAIFEVFTPPLIYYHREANTFSLTPPLPTGDASEDFGVELVGRFSQPAGKVCPPPAIPVTP